MKRPRDEEGPNGRVLSDDSGPDDTDLADDIQYAQPPASTQQQTASTSTKFFARSTQKSVATRPGDGQPTPKRPRNVTASGAGGGAGRGAGRGRRSSKPGAAVQITPQLGDSSQPSQSQSQSSVPEHVRAMYRVANPPDIEACKVAWARPPVKITTRDPLVFQKLEIDYTVGDPIKGMPGSPVKPVPIVRMFGVNEAGNSILLNVHGFTPYFYVKAPPGFHENSCAEFRHAFNDVAKSFMTGAMAHPHKDYILDVRIEKKQSLLYYHNNIFEDFLRISCSLPKQVPQLRSLLEKGALWGRNMPTYESDILFVLRFMIDTGLSGYCWVRIEAGHWDILPPDMRTSHCQIEAFCSVEDIKNLGFDNEWAKVAPLRILSFDIECAGRKGLFPDAAHDPVIQIANMITLQGDTKPIIKNIMTLRNTSSIVGAEVLSFNQEEAMLSAWQQFLISADPDILTGYNIVNFDIPYLLDRCKTILPRGPPIKWSKIKTSRVQCENASFKSKALGRRESKEISVDGRTTFDMLQVIQREHKLRSFTLNFVSATFLGEQKEEVHHSNITELFDGSPDDRRRLAVYCLKDAYLPQRLMDNLMCLTNYIEMSRVVGVPLSYLLGRGQGIKVMTQIYKKANADNLLVPFVQSEKKKDGKEKGFQGADVLKPVKGYHDTPVTTLDFSSLYPSIMMSHNLCYSTWVQSEEAKNAMKLTPDQYEVTPQGAMFIRSTVRQGVLPKILQSLLQARAHAKELLSKETDPGKRAVYDGRQLALKITANSVYGFTGAQRGKLPCTDIAAGVTAYGRAMILLTKNLIETKYSGSRVIYGDTDSVMVIFDTKDISEAMRLGKAAADVISEEFPKPVRLLFEKVYYPYLLITKKRYAGLLWTDPSQPGKIDTKGLESVRRDNCPLVKHVMTTCLEKILIERNIPSSIEFVKGIISNLLQNKLDLSLLVISKALSKSSSEYAAKQAHVELAQKLHARDSATAPGVGDRVPYVIVSAFKGSRAYEKAEDPLYALEKNLPLDYDYYIHQQLELPVTRIFKNLLQDPSSLFKGEHTRTRIITTPVAEVGGILGFAKKVQCCVGCRALLPSSDSAALCTTCETKRVSLYSKQVMTVRELEQKYCRVWTQCQHCMGSMHQPIICANRDCPIFYMRTKVKKDLQEAQDTLQRFDDW
ncbi:DNA polymerase delta catalytic subunit [Pelomyxa schiedti]|nr:DNA polymerase delta catalytic subunit [Pelomyxa schiedti]